VLSRLDGKGRFDRINSSEVPGNFADPGKPFLNLLSTEMAEIQIKMIKGLRPLTTPAILPSQT